MMRKAVLIIAVVFMSINIYADGGKTMSLRGRGYNPNPNSGNVVPALNIYAGLGAVYGSRMGTSFGLDYEIPVIDPNLTLGPGLRVGMAQYYHAHYVDNVYYSSTTQMSFYGGVVAHYYVDWLIPNMPDEFDVFITSNAGYGLVTYSSGRDPQPFFDFGFAIGGRWNFSDNISLYAQAGQGTSTILAGISFKM